MRLERLEGSCGAWLESVAMDSAAADKAKADAGMVLSLVDS